MKLTGMPAGRLTADCIWSSFRSSGKRHLILTGAKGSGKTTLLSRLFPEGCPGITTWAVPKQAVYLRENLSGETAQVGVFDPGLPGPGNQMAAVDAGFEALGVPALLRCGRGDHPWVTVDEVGYLEARCRPYQEALEALLEKKQVAMAVRKQDLPFLQRLCRREDVFLADLDDPFGNVGCVIMASGLGKRFGGNKLMADFHGQPMIHRILDATEEIFPRRVVVTRSREVAALCEARNIPALLHDLPHRSDTVRLGLEAMGEVARCMFAAADQPLLRRQTVAALALAAANDPESIHRPVCGDIPGSPVVFPKWAFPELMALPEGQGGGVLIKKYPERLRRLAVRDLYELKDADTPQELEALRNR